MRRKHAGLTFKTENRAVNIRLLKQHTGIVGKIARRKIIGAVHDDIVGPNQIEGIF